MKIAFFSILSLATLALAVNLPQKAVIVSYPDDTPARIIDDAKNAITAAGGMITHEYNIFKGFAAKAPAKVLETIQTLGNSYPALIEEDQMVTADS